MQHAHNMAFTVLAEGDDYIVVDKPAPLQIHPGSLHGAPTLWHGLKDLLAYEMAITGADFTTAARTLGAWVDDGKPAPTKPSPFTARDALEVLRAEAVLVAVAAGTLAQGGVLADSDRKRLLMAADRVQTIVEVA